MLAMLAMLAMVAGVVVPSLVPVTLCAQQLGWSGAVEASGNLLFGNARDRLVSGRVQVGRADSTLEVRSDARLTYAEGTRDDGGRKVTGRTSFASLALDYTPFNRYSPFWFGSVESSLQQRIAQRFSTGAGGKLTLYNKNDDEASVSLALLAERTRPRDPGADGGDRAVSADWRARWSVRARTRQKLTDGVRFTHVTFYQPSVARMGRFTVNSTTSLAASLTSTISLTVTFQDTYDSEARGRGARSNNDGQLLFGLRAGF
jgi:hypothetical protein